MPKRKIPERPKRARIPERGAASRIARLKLARRKLVEKNKDLPVSERRKNLDRIEELAERITLLQLAKLKSRGGSPAGRKKSARPGNTRKSDQQKRS